MKEALCKEFCDQLQVRKVPAGLAVGTSFMGLNGDRIGFYVIGPSANGLFQIEDSGTTVPILEACGADIELGTRAQAFHDLLDQYEAEYDEDRGELKSRLVRESEVPKAALKFVALLLRLQDLMLLTKEKAESTFKEEALRDLKRTIGDRAIITVDDVVSDELNEFRADAVVRAFDRIPVAVFFVTADPKLYEAMLLQTEAEHKAHVECRVVALLERESCVSRKAFSYAMNRLIPLRYRGDEKSAMQRIALESLGRVH